ncbi:unnamed protein product [Pylaiella littoralis]
MAGGKIEPGLSFFADSPTDAAGYMLPLLAKASELVPPENHSATKVFIKSTAGMRLLPREIQDAIHDEIYAALVGNPAFPFSLYREEVGTIDGEQEAYYAVLSANYLAGRIDARMHPTGHLSGEIGALDMGGASTQIIFRHKDGDHRKGYDVSRTHRDDSHFTSNNRSSRSGSGSGGGSSSSSSSSCDSPGAGQSARYSGSDDARATQEEEGEGEGEARAGEVEQAEARSQQTFTAPVSQSDFWGASHLGYGAAEVRLRIWDFLLARDHHSDRARGRQLVVNPCSFVGRVDEWKGHRLVGSGDHVLCEEIVAAVLWGQGSDGGEGREEEEEEQQEGDESGGPCGGQAAGQRRCRIGGVTMPPLSGEFLAMSVFFYATHCLHKLGPAGLSGWPTPTLVGMRAAAREFCAMDWGAVQHRKDTLSAEDSLFDTSEEGLPHRCLEVVYMTTLLRDGYGFPENSRNVTFALEADGMELEWTLGYALAELARSRESPPNVADVAVENGGAARRGMDGKEGTALLVMVGGGSDVVDVGNVGVGVGVGGDGSGVGGGGGGGGGEGDDEFGGGTRSSGSDSGTSSCSSSSSISYDIRKSSSTASTGSSGASSSSSAVANRTEPGGAGGVHSYLAAAVAAMLAAGPNWKTLWNRERQE